MAWGAATRVNARGSHCENAERNKTGVVHAGTRAVRCRTKVRLESAGFQMTRVRLEMSEMEARVRERAPAETARHSPGWSRSRIRSREPERSSFEAVVLCDWEPGCGTSQRAERGRGTLRNRPGALQRHPAAHSAVGRRGTFQPASAPPVLCGPSSHLKIYVGCAPHPYFRRRKFKQNQAQSAGSRAGHLERVRTKLRAMTRPTG